MIINLPEQFSGIPLQVIETANTLIINSVPFDKKSLVQLSPKEIKANHGRLKMPSLSYFFPIRLDNYDSAELFVASPGSAPSSSEVATFYFDRIFGFTHGENRHLVR